MADALVARVVAPSVRAGRLVPPTASLDVCARSVLLTCLDAVRRASGSRGCADFVSALRQLADESNPAAKPEW